jgi:hypothetical protein
MRAQACRHDETRVSKNCRQRRSWGDRCALKRHTRSQECVLHVLRPSADAIRQAAERHAPPVDNVTPVTVLDPYFYNDLAWPFGQASGHSNTEQLSREGECDARVWAAIGVAPGVS